MNALRRHKSADCELRLGTCQYCEASLPVRDMRAHEARCGAETVRCEVCAERVPRRLLDVHTSSHIAE